MKKTTRTKIMQVAAIATVVCGVISGARAQNYVSTLNGLNPILYFPFNDANPVWGEVYTNLGTAGVWGEAVALVACSNQIPGALAFDSDTAVQMSYTLYHDPGPSGHGGFIAVPISPEMNPSYQDSWANNANPTAPFSLELWVNPWPATFSNGMGSQGQDQTGGSTSTPCLVSFCCEGANGITDGNNNAEGFNLYLNFQSDAYTGLIWQMYNNAGQNLAANLTTSESMNAGTWYHVVVTYDGATASLYFNGALAGSTPVTGFYPCVSANAMLFGMRTDMQGGYQYLGGMDELAIYTNALTAAQVLADYNAGTSVPSPSYTSLVSARNPLLYYRFDDPQQMGSSDTYGGFSPATSAANLGSLGSAENAIISGGLVSMPPIPAVGIANNTATLKIGSGLGGQDNWYNSVTPQIITSPFDGGDNWGDNGTNYTGGMIVSVPPYDLGTQFSAYSIVCWFVDNTTNQGMSGPNGNNGSIGGAGKDGFISCHPDGGSGNNGGGDTGIWFFDSNGRTLHFQYAGNDDSGQWSPSGSTFVNPSLFTWNMMAVVWNASGTTVFIDGTNYSVSQSHSPLTFGNGGWQFGNLDGNGGGQLNGCTVNVQMGQVAMFGYDLSPSQVSSLWQQAELLPQVNGLAVSPGNVVAPGTSVTFNVNAYASGTISYQWLKNGGTIGGATSSSYNIPSAASTDAADYSVQLITSYGTVTSGVLPLEVATVAITSPANGGSIPTGNTTVSVDDTMTSVETVQLYFTGSTGTSLLDTLTSPPYQFTANIEGVLGDSVTLTVVSTDSNGNSVTSAPVVLTLSTGPTYTPGTNMVLWLNAAAGVTLNGGGMVTQWDDQSGHNNNAVLGACGGTKTSPTITATPVNYDPVWWSGNPGVHFEGSANEFLEIPNSPSLEITGDISFVVFVQDNANSQATFPWWMGGWSGLPSPNGMLFGGGSSPYLDRGDGANNQNYVYCNIGVDDEVANNIVGTQSGEIADLIFDLNDLNQGNRESVTGSGPEWTYGTEAAGSPFVVTPADGEGSSPMFIGTRGDGYGLGGYPGGPNGSDIEIGDLMIFNTSTPYGSTSFWAAENYINAKYNGQDYASAVQTPIPTLTATLSGGSVVLSWPTSYNGYVLQSASSLYPAPITWTAVAGVVNNQVSVTPSGHMFYRLQYLP
jgi:hypothetical protein